MFPGLLLGRIAGIPIRLRWSFLFLLGFVLLTAGGWAGVGAVLVAFASIVLHELGHAVVAERRGVRIGGIDLHFFGGAARMLDAPRSAKDEIAIAAAGPAVSLVLAALGLALGELVPAVAMVGWINLALALFNLIPALPMDGGRILRAALAPRLGYLRATDVAVTVARVFIVLFAIGGIAVFQSVQLVLLAGVLWFMSAAERRAAPLSAYGSGVRPDGIDWVNRPTPVRVIVVRW